MSVAVVYSFQGQRAHLCALVSDHWPTLNSGRAFLRDGEAPNGSILNAICGCRDEEDKPHFYNRSRLFSCLSHRPRGFAATTVKRVRKA